MVDRPRMEEKPPWILHRTASWWLLLATGCATYGYASHRVAFAAWLHENFWGLPVPLAYAMMATGLAVLILASSNRTTLLVNAERRTLVFSRFILFAFRISRREAEFDDIRFIDVHDTGGLRTFGIPPVADIVNPSGKSTRYYPFANEQPEAISPLHWIREWVTGSSELRIRLEDGTEWLCLKSSSEAHILRSADALRDITGARVS